MPAVVTPCDNDGMSEPPSTEPVDWRGTPITPGALVIYGAPVNRSIALVEAIVADPMLTPSGRIWLEVQRRAYGGWGDGSRRVHVGADRLTVVDSLPPTTRLTEQEKADRYEEQVTRREAWQDRHHAEQGHIMETSPHSGRTYTYCAQDCFQEGRRFDKAWEAGQPLDEAGR